MNVTFVNLFVGSHILLPVQGSAVRIAPGIGTGALFQATNATPR
jgi:hypothetical protein